MPISVRKPKAIVLDILGTASKSGFLEQILFPYLKVHLDDYVTKNWSKKDFLSLYAKIVEQSVELNQQDASAPVVEGHESPNARTTLANFINFVSENGVNCTAVTKLRFKVWFDGYNESKIKTPIYKDVAVRMKEWHAEGVKFYVFSNTWIEAQRALFKRTNHGDLSALISGYFDNDFGMLTEPDSWLRLCSEIRERPADVLFLTKAPLEGRAALDAGLSVVLVLTHRHNVRAVSAEDRQRFPFVRTLNDLQLAGGQSQVSSRQTDSSAAR